MNAALATLADTFPAAADTLVVSATDTPGDNAGPISIPVAAAVPILAVVAPGRGDGRESAPTAIPGVSLSEPGAAPDETFTATLSVGAGVLTATGTGVTGSGTASLSIAGTLDTVNAALATLSDSESVNGDDLISVNASDNLGNTGAYTVVTFAETLSSSTSTNLTCSMSSRRLRAPFPMSAWSEPGALAGRHSPATLSVAKGILTATGTGVSGSGTANLTVTGSLDQVNAALATLSDTETSGGPDKIVIDAADSFGDLPPGPVDIGVTSLGPAITAPATLNLTIRHAHRRYRREPDPTQPPSRAKPYTRHLYRTPRGILSATGDNVAGDATTTLTLTGALSDINAALATLYDRSFSPGGDTIGISVTDSQAIHAAPVGIAVTTASPVLPAINAFEEDSERLVTGFGTLTDSASGQDGAETSTMTVTSGLDPVLTASVSSTGANPPQPTADASVTIFFEILGAPFTSVPVIFAGLETSAASSGYFGADAIVTLPNQVMIEAETDGTGPSGFPASQSFAQKVTLGTDRVYSVTYQVDATGPSPGANEGTTGTAMATLDPVITIDPSFANASRFTLAADNIPCFLAGSRILTDRGEIPVEALSVGDRVVTISGETAPIVWIGRGRKLITPGQRSDATPVLVRRGALAPGVPRRDLRVTKGHALFLDDALIPAEFLINYRSILWDDGAREVAYYHIELAPHDVLLAEGAAAETYRDDGNRALFHNANSRGWQLQPRRPCASVLTGGPIVDAVWRRLLDRSVPGVRVAMTDQPDLHLLVDGERVDGRRGSNGAHLFRLTRAANEVRVVSRAGVPARLGLARAGRFLGDALRRISRCGEARGYMCSKRRTLRWRRGFPYV